MTQSLDAYVPRARPSVSAGKAVCDGHNIVVAGMDEKCRLPQMLSAMGKLEIAHINADRLVKPCQHSFGALGIEASSSSEAASVMFIAGRRRDQHDPRGRHSGAESFSQNRRTHRVRDDSMERAEFFACGAQCASSVRDGRLRPRRIAVSWQIHCQHGKARRKKSLSEFRHIRRLSLPAMQQQYRQANSGTMNCDLAFRRCKRS